MKLSTEYWEEKGRQAGIKALNSWTAEQQKKTNNWVKENAHFITAPDGAMIVNPEYIKK